MKPNVYAKAMHLLHLEGKSDSEVVSGTITTLKKRGAVRLLPKVLKAYKHLADRAQSTSSVLTIARASDKAAALVESNAKEGTVVKIDSGIIGGYRLESGSSLVDNSFKTRLLQVYRNATSA